MTCRAVLGCLLIVFLAMQFPAMCAGQVEARSTRLLEFSQEIMLLCSSGTRANLGRVSDCEPRALLQDDQESDEPKWRELFDGETLDGWESAEFGGEGQVEVKDGAIVMGMGVSLTGVTYKGEVPKSNYEISLEAKQVEGIDFFCGLTFPVADSHCSFIVGGWAGSVVGLSSIDGMDASENETTKVMYFDKDKWYRVRVRVEDDRIQCWIDDERVVNQSIVDREIDIRPEVSLSRPLGISSWQTTAALRNIKIRSLQQDQ